MKYQKIFLISVLMFLLLCGDLRDAAALDTQRELAYRAALGRPADVAYLLKQGGDPNSVNEQGWPLIALAANRTDGEALAVVKLLVDAGGDPGQGGKVKQFPITLAASRGDLELVEYLLEKGADPDTQDANGDTVYAIARYNGYDAINALLEDNERKKREAYAERHNPARRDKLIPELAHEYCIAYYDAYYFTSKQDKHTPGHEASVMKDHEEKISVMTGDLLNIFRVHPHLITSIQNGMQLSVQTELDEMISNRFRKKQGVGTEKDRQERCRRIAQEWMKNAKPQIKQALPD